MQYRQHVIPTQQRRPARWWVGMALFTTGCLVFIFGAYAMAARWDGESDARVVLQPADLLALRQQAADEAVEALKPTILDAYHAGLADGAAHAGRSCRQGAL